MILEELEKKIEQYRKLMVEMFGDIPALQNAYKPITRQSKHIVNNLLEDFLENYNVKYFNYYEKITFLSKEERPNIDGYIVFAENVGSNFCYVYNPNEEGRIFCLTIDTGDYMWEAAKSYKSFFQLLIEFIDLDMHPTTNGDLTDDEYKEYFNRCMSIVEGDKDLEEYIKFMCCIVD
jgi:hypothetical protein